MVKVEPLHSRSEVDRAGLVLGRGIGGGESQDALDSALDVVNNWRWAHRVPLNAIQVAVRQRARLVDAHATVPQRLKRMPAIESKLHLHPGMQLSRMHDIGGCRAIVSDIAAVKAVVLKCEEAAAKNPLRRAKLIRKYDYIDGQPGPKIDGYRGIHLVYQYRSDSPALKVFNGLRIEVQVRSRLQHAFATAVETAGIFTKQPIKSIKANLNDERWREFFALIGSAFALREGTALVPGITSDAATLSARIGMLANELNVENALRGWGETVETLSTKGRSDGARAFLILLDAEAKTTSVIAFGQRELLGTEEEYLRIERESKGNPNQQVVWVSAESIEALRIGYPNFYLDTNAFINAMHQVIKGELVSGEFDA